MKSGRTVFLVGLVFGAAVGFAAGSLLFRGRVAEQAPLAGSEKPRDAFESVPNSYEPVLAEPDFLPADLGESVSPLTTALANTPAEKRLSPPSPQAGATPRDHSGSLPGAARPAPPTLATSVPQPLTVANAAPLHRDTPDEDQAIRELISRELGDAPDAQKEVWFESLRDLPKEDAANVLKMWNRFGAPGAGFPSASGTAVRDGLAPGEPNSPHLAPSPAAGDRTIDQDPLLQAKLVRLRNIALRETPGFKRQIPVLIEADPSIAGLEIAAVDVRVDFSQGPRTVTECPLDWAIEGEGFFAVTDGRSTFYTRSGRWTLDDERRIVLSGINPPLRLDGKWQIPAGATGIQLTPQGLLTATVASDDQVESIELGQVLLARFLNPAGLQPRANTLFSETSASGPAQTGPPQQGGRGSLRQGALELSNVDAEEEFLALEDLDVLAETE